MILTYRVTVALSAALTVVGCQAASDVASVPTSRAGGALGASCDASRPCEAHWLCLDGYCVARPWAERGLPASSEPLAEPRMPRESRQDVATPGAALEDVAGDAGDAGVVSDAEGDVVVGPHMDTVSGPTEGADGGVADVPAEDVGQGTSGGQDAEDAPTEVVTPSVDLDTESGGSDADVTGPVDQSDILDAVDDAGTEEDSVITIAPPKKVVFLVAEDSWEQGVATPTLIPEQGQGWVTQLDAPSEGTLLGIQAMMGAPFGASSCGLYRIALWFPFGDGEFNAHPSWIAAQPIVITPHDEPYVWLIEELPEVPEGLFRLGLIVDDPCQVDTPRPALLSDTSEGEGGTWLYSVDAGVSALVPAEAFGVSGRWILRALIEVALE
jgi:hypothetical protein